MAFKYQSVFINLPMTGFELRTSIGSDHSTKRATTTVHSLMYLKLKFFQKMGQSRPLFNYCRPFPVTISIIQIEKSIDGVLGIRDSSYDDALFDTFTYFYYVRIIIVKTVLTIQICIFNWLSASIYNAYTTYIPRICQLKINQCIC